MPSQQQINRLADLQARLDGRLDASGNPLKGYRKNVVALKMAIAAQNLQMARAEPATNLAESGAETQHVDTHVAL